MANAYVRMRHPDYDALRGMLDDVGPHRARPRELTRAAVTPSITLLGPQRRPTLDRVLSSLDVDGPVADRHRRLAGARVRRRRARSGCSAGGASTCGCTPAGWTCCERDPEYAAAEREHRAVLDELQQLYLVQLDHALQAAVRGGRAAAAAAPQRPGDARWPTRWRRCGCSTRRTWPGSRQLHDDFYGAWRPEERAADRRAPRGGAAAAVGPRRAWSSPAGTSACWCACCTCSTWRRTCRRGWSPGRPGRWR